MGIKNKRAGKDNFPVLFYCLLQDSTTIHKTITTIHGSLQLCTTFALLYIGIVYLYISVLRLLKVHFQEKTVWNTQNGGAFLFDFEIKNVVFSQLFGIKSCIFPCKNEKSTSKWRYWRHLKKVLLLNHRKQPVLSTEEMGDCNTHLHTKRKFTNKNLCA